VPGEGVTSRALYFGVAMKAKKLRLSPLELDHGRLASKDHSPHIRTGIIGSDLAARG
jgi:hypothetical protein